MGSEGATALIEGDDPTLGACCGEIFAAKAEAAVWAVSAPLDFGDEKKWVILWGLKMDPLGEEWSLGGECGGTAVVTPKAGGELVGAVCERRMAS